VPSPKRELPELELPRSLIFTSALTCGVLAALVVQIQLSRAGMDVTRLLQNPSSTLRMAGPWWAIAGSAFIASGAVAAALSRFPPPWRSFRLLRWILGGIIVFGLAHAGHAGAAPVETGAGMQVGASLAALCVAVLMAMFGAYFTVRR
jgi:hypothetical protein